MIETIPLNKLVQSPRNVRKHADSAADAELRASIAAVGLLQNLVVRAGAKGKFEVEAGERRRRAMLSLADEKVLPRDHPVTCLVLDKADATCAASLAENFHRLAMNPADEAEAFAALVGEGASVEDVARRFGLTVRFVEGRLRLATLAPVVFEALGQGRITLDMAKAYGATSDQAIQERVFEQVSTGYYAPSPDSVRRMVLSGTVRGSDPRARLVGRDAYVAAGGRIDRELFDDEESEAWADVALLETLALARMEEQAAALVEQEGLAWVKPTLDGYAPHDLTEGLIRLPTTPAPIPDADMIRLDELDAAYDDHAAVLENEDSGEEAIAAAEAAIAAIERETEAIRHRPPKIDPELKREAGMILTLGRDGSPVLQPVYYAKREPQGDAPDDGVVEIVASGEGETTRRSVLSKRLVDELAMQRRDVLALHVASDPALALDVLVFMLADADGHDWRAQSATTLRGPRPSGPTVGFEPGDALAIAALAELRSALDESWRSGEDAAERFDLYRALSDEARAAWLGFVVARTFEASLNASGDRRIAFHDHLGAIVGIDMAQWWRPTAANYFDRVSKAVILDALRDVGGVELASRFGAAKKGDLASSAERVFSGAFITDADVRDNALAWVPEVMRFADAPVAEATNSGADDVGETWANGDPAPPTDGFDDSPSEMAA